MRVFSWTVNVEGRSQSSRRIGRRRWKDQDGPLFSCGGAEGDPGMTDNYTGPNWVGPLFKWIAAVAVLSYVLGFTYEVEWSSTG
jgi:hypothetical protein